MPTPQTSPPPSVACSAVVLPMSRRQLKRLRQYEKRNTSKRRAKKRDVLWRETGGHCVYCNAQPAEKERSLDHIWPAARGGTWANENLMPACRDCNTRRQAKFPASRHVHPHWRSYVEKKERAMGLFGQNSNFNQQ